MKLLTMRMCFHYGMIIDVQHVLKQAHDFLLECINRAGDVRKLFVRENLPNIFIRVLLSIMESRLPVKV